MQVRLGVSSPLSSTSRDADQDSPLAVLTGAVADNLCAHHVGRAIKDLGRAAVTLQAQCRTFGQLGKPSEGKEALVAWSSSRSTYSSTELTHGGEHTAQTAPDAHLHVPVVDRRRRDDAQRRC
jgi:hypothetical protein